METHRDKINVRVEKLLRFSADTVFDAWLNPELISKWMFGPDVRKETIVQLSNNAVKGGTFSYIVKRGEEIIEHVGTYLELTRSSLLVFSWGVGEEAGKSSIVTISITPTPEGCLLTLIHEMDSEWASYADRTREGWTFMINLLAERL